MCLAEKIGIRNVCEDQNVKFYINDLEGVTLNFTESINDEAQNGVELLERKKQLAQELIKNDIQNAFGDKIISKSLVESDVVGYYNQDLKTVSSIPGKHGGVLIESNDYTYKEIYISRVFVNLATTTTIDLKVYDLMTGKIIKTVPVDAIANEPVEVNLDLTYYNNNQRVQLFVCWELTQDSIDGGVYQNGYCSTCGGNQKHSNSYLNFTGGIAEGPFTKSSFKSSGSIYGLSVEYSLNCSMESFICKNADSLSLPMLYKIGELLMAEARYSDLNNSFVLVNYNQNEELLERFAGLYEETINNVFKRMDTPKNDPCFKCFGAMKRIVNIP